MSTQSLNPPRRVIDVSQLPHTVFGTGRSILWWATILMTVIEGSFFAYLIAAYFYLRTRVNDWPPGIDPPYLLYGSINLGLMLLSTIPNQILKKAAAAQQFGKVRALLVLMSLVAVAGIIIRWFEFPALRCMWYDNAYASVAWVLLGMHTVHVLTDSFDTWVLTTLFFTGPFQPKRFMDAYENTDYWYFVVLTWIPVYLVLYWAPRWL